MTVTIEKKTPGETQPAVKPPVPSHAERPSGTRPTRMLWSYAIGIPLIHALSLLALIPWFFSWAGVISFVIGYYAYGLLGITLGYHRLLTHKGLVAPKWFERFLATLGVCCMQDSPARWVAIHRKHHQYSDEHHDPHSPLVDFFWGHMGWLMIENRDMSKIDFYDRYARDILKDPYYRWIEKRHMWFWLFVLHAALYLVIGTGIGWAVSGSYWAGVQLGASLLVWGVFVRTVIGWHVTWAVNSLTHVVGYQNYETGDNSRNFWLVGLLAHGEGWHNNHHADQRAARHGHRWWEFDLTWCVIRLLESVGLVRQVVRPRSDLKLKNDAG